MSLFESGNVRETNKITELYCRISREDESIQDGEYRMSKTRIGPITISIWVHY